MCWDVWIDGKPIGTRDALEDAIEMKVFYHNDAEREPEDHCLCPVDVPGTLVDAKFAVRAHRPDDDQGMAGDWVAWR